VEYLPLEELTRQCHIVSLHLPATADSHHLVDRAFLASMRPGAFLVNTARGAIVDDEALCAALRSGHLAGAALDAYDPEPLPPGHPLVTLAAECPDALILCPHQGGITSGAFQMVYRMLFDNLEKLMNGQRPDHVVNGL
jgi:D-3-phosphoglycerate dehydrogenase